MSASRDDAVHRPEGEPSTAAKPGHRPDLARLALLSASGLFLELALIRFVPGSVRVVGYFTNLILMSAFLGLGAGALLSRYRRSVFGLWPWLLLALITATLVLGAAQTADPSGQHIWSGDAPHIEASATSWLDGRLPGAEALASALRGLSFYFVVSLLFVLTAALFVTIGQRIGHLFERLPPLPAYGADLAGSLAGVLAFTLCARLSTPPWLWFAFAIMALGVMTPWRGLRGAGRIGAVVAVLGLTWAAGAPYIWSPYYKIEVGPVTPPGAPVAVDDQAAGEAKPFGWRIRVNNDYHQMALRLADAPTQVAVVADDAPPQARRDAFIAGWRTLYDLPYRDHKAGRVLVVGAGTGNDVQAALRNGATRVTAVEIDPAILALGRTLHPEQPYADARVEVVVDDARSYFASALADPTARFDTVVFGFLDSHTLLSSFSTLRIDNYVYTVESFREAARLLVDGGRLAVTFTTATAWLRDRLYGLMTVALGTPPQTTKVPWTNGRIFWGHRDTARGALTDANIAALADQTELPTDNWPFLYLERPGLPGHYVFFMLLVVLLGIGSFALVERADRRINLELFFLGAGFMLLETRSITEMALLFGSTWAVNAVTFAAILTAVLAANAIASRWSRPPLPALYLGVVLLLVAGWWAEPGQLRGADLPLRLTLACSMFFSPVLLAGIIFSSRFKHAARPNLLFGSNLLGAMVGGAVEYLGMAFGLESLYLIGAVLYLAALASGLRRP